MLLNFSRETAQYHFPLFQQGHRLFSLPWFQGDTGGTKFYNSFYWGTALDNITGREIAVYLIKDWLPEGYISHLRITWDLNSQLLG